MYTCICMCVCIHNYIYSHLCRFIPRLYPFKRQPKSCLKSRKHAFEIRSFIYPSSSNEDPLQVGGFNPSEKMKVSWDDCSQ